MRSNVRIKHVTEEPVDIEEGQRMAARSETGRRIRSGRCTNNGKEGYPEARLTECLGRW